MLSFTADLASFHSTVVEKEQQLEAAKRRIEEADKELQDGDVREGGRGGEGRGGRGFMVRPPALTARKIE
jgi:hypothetical protein